MRSSSYIPHWTAFVEGQCKRADKRSVLPTTEQNTFVQLWVDKIQTGRQRCQSSPSCRWCSKTFSSLSSQRRLARWPSGPTRYLDDALSHCRVGVTAELIWVSSLLSRCCALLLLLLMMMMMMLKCRTFPFPHVAIRKFFPAKSTLTSYQLYP